jgi:glycolate oxidase iron-sulfur subunit
MKGLHEGRLTTEDETLAWHLDRCLGCRACEPVCPSGVEYAPALEASRELLARFRPIPASVRLIHAVMAEPLLRRPLLALARMIRPLAAPLVGAGRLRFALGMLVATRYRWRPIDTSNPAGARDATAQGIDTPVVLFGGCIMEGLFSHVHAATERVLRANGYEPVKVTGQGCCGALHVHAGQDGGARRLARQNLAAFAAAPNEALIAVDAAGCGALLKEYDRVLDGEHPHGELMAFTARVHDVSELLASCGPRRGGPLPLRVAYDPPCHLLHAQRVSTAPEKLLGAIPELKRVWHEDAELCCGSAGSYSLAQPELSLEVLERKVDAICASSPDLVVTGNPGCAMQIGAGLRARGSNIGVVHPVELLDRSYERAGFYGH